MSLVTEQCLPSMLVKAPTPRSRVPDTQGLQRWDEKYIPPFSHPREKEPGLISGLTRGARSVAHSIQNNPHCFLKVRG